MTAWTDAELYRRGAGTLLASWEEYARGAAGAVGFRDLGRILEYMPRDPAG